MKAIAETIQALIVILFAVLVLPEAWVGLVIAALVIGALK